MVPVDRLIRRILALRQEGRFLTLLAVCPNSDAVLEAAVKVAATENMPMLFAATLNQVDRDGGYTGWTPQAFVDRMRQLAARHSCDSPLYPCLDHGGPWLKDLHTLRAMTYQQTMAEVKASITACLQAGYALLHIDPTVDRGLPPGQPIEIERVVERTVELIAHAEDERSRLGLQPISYEVGTEEVHGGLADFATFDRFLIDLRSSLSQRGLSHVWPCFIVGKVGTDLHTTMFDRQVARRLYERVAPLGSLIKGHYTDWVANPADYPTSGMGGANVGPELTSAELSALRELCTEERRLFAHTPRRSPSGFEAAVETAVTESGRWKKWILSEEAGRRYDELDPARREWLIATGARYTWTDPRVLSARQTLYHNLQPVIPDPHGVVVDRIAQAILAYVEAFNLKDCLPALIA
jgi:D-tagatose-1,6-bisphosphate aldolase subunit GatZ/KbaZ